MQEPPHVRFIFDTAEIDAQLKEFSELLESRFPQGIPNEISSHISRLSFDVIFADTR